MELQEQLQAVKGVGLSIGRLRLALRQMGLRLINPHFLFEVGLNRRMIGPTPAFMRS